MPERSFGPVVVRRRLGSELRRLRDRAGLSLEQVAAELEVSPSKISRLENGQSPAKLWDVRNLLTLYGVEDEAYRRRAERWVTEGKSEGWWHPYSDAVESDLDHYISLESEAAEIRAFCAPFLHGLLQTRGYAHALTGALLPELDDATVEGLVDVRMRRQDIFLRRESPAAVRVIIDESVLARKIGDDDVMRDQLTRLAGLGDWVDIRVRRMTAPPHVALQGSFTIFFPRESDIDPTVVNLESSFRDAYFEDKVAVNQFMRSFEDLARTALSPEESVALLRRLIAGTTTTER
jgi:transcriptional regulator with XRE-family HTH domain